MFDCLCGIRSGAQAPELPYRKDWRARLDCGCANARSCLSQVRLKISFMIGGGMEDCGHDEVTVIWRPVINFIMAAITSDKLWS